MGGIEFGTVNTLFQGNPVESQGKERINIFKNVS